MKAAIETKYIKKVVLYDTSIPVYISTSSHLIASYDDFADSLYEEYVKRPNMLVHQKFLYYVIEDSHYKANTISTIANKEIKIYYKHETRLGDRMDLDRFYFYEVE